MADSGGSERRPRRGPAPIASFDHDVSDESSPETKQTFRLPEIREDAGGGLAPPEQRARSYSSPAVGLQAPAAPRIDISRASSSSHHDSRDSSPELALFAGAGSGEESRAKLELGFREDGALDLRSSTEELAFLENIPVNGEPRAPLTAPSSRRHSRKDSQGSETALLAVSGRTSRLSSVGSQCSAHSAVSAFSHTSRVSRLSVVSGMSRSPSPHKMLLETSFCGPKPIETDPEICAAVVEERLLEIAKLSSETTLSATPVDARDRREIRTEVTLESSSLRATTLTKVVSNVPSAPEQTQKSVTVPVPSLASTTELQTETMSATIYPLTAVPADEEKRLKETRNRARVEERKARSKGNRHKPEPEVFKTSNRSKDIIRIRLKPDDEYDEADEESDHTLIGTEPVRKPATLELNDNSALISRPASRSDLVVITPQTTPRRRDSRTPSPSGVAVSRKSSFCSLFKSKETIASPDSPDALKRKKSLNEGRSRSKSRDRSVTPTSTGKIKGSVLSLFKVPRKSATSPSASSRDASPVVQSQRQFPQGPSDHHRGEKLKYYEETKEGIIHIPLHTPPDELDSVSDKTELKKHEVPRPSSAPQIRSTSVTPVSSAYSTKPAQRTVLPDGSIIIPLHSPTEKTSNASIAPELSKIVHNYIVKEDQILRETKVINDNSSRTKNQNFPDVASIPVDPLKAKRRDRLTFTTHVGSREQVFSTQFSITKTPSITSEISGSIPSFLESEDVKIAQTEQEPDTPAIENDINLGSDSAERRVDETLGEVESLEYPTESLEGSEPGTPQDPGRDSSESEAGSDAVTRGGSDAERRGLVVQESFEELPYVPTTLPQERSLAVPIVPVRERGGVSVAGVRRPRASRATNAPPSAPLPTNAPPPAPSPHSPPSAPPVIPRLHIRLPRRPRAASTSAAPPRPERPRTRSGSEAGSSRKGEWIDFSEVPERRKQPKRIQTLPAEGREALSYAPPERCRCECHANPPPLPGDAQLFTLGSAEEEPQREGAAPFTADLDLHNRDDSASLPATER
ncbi:serine/arginine repetitive matrix protein 1 [Pieris brassicae]|uniref:serine/arginine repetitive matrix protein 1 n=1 Tax=Pieris brassicae TaxID=7116 RepID=UPI001E660137|nr:serine/arginine repetitive matrix protein 1 [Pieris brassicae]XP_045524301.1 serine/arginine repetitive matrix protein 1 [Pieris brassicae]